MWEIGNKIKVNKTSKCRQIYDEEVNIWAGGADGDSRAGGAGRADGDGGADGAGRVEPMGLVQPMELIELID